MQERIDELIASIKSLLSDQFPSGVITGLNRKTVTREVEVDTDRLYGPMPGAIAYLQEVHAQYPHAMLDEHWTGYEDMQMRFAWGEPQTDEEYIRDLQLRESLETYHRKRRDEEREQKRKQLLAQKKKIEEELKKCT